MQSFIEKSIFEDERCRLICADIAVSFQALWPSQRSEVKKIDTRSEISEIKYSLKLRGTKTKDAIQVVEYILKLIMFKCLIIVNLQREILIVCCLSSFVWRFISTERGIIR